MVRKATPTIDVAQIKDINSAADFYGWKEHIIREIEAKDGDYAARLRENNSVYDFFMQKTAILKILDLVGE